jgi:excisionase family DNA binding protein
MTTAKADPPLPPWLADIARDLPPLLDVDQVAVVLHMHHRTVRKHVADRTLRAVRNVPGSGSSRVMIPRVAVIDWLRAREIV